MKRNTTQLSLIVAAGILSLPVKSYSTLTILAPGGFGSDVTPTQATAVSGSGQYVTGGVRLPAQKSQGLYWNLSGTPFVNAAPSNPPSDLKHGIQYGISNLGSSAWGTCGVLTVTANGLSGITRGNIDNAAYEGEEFERLDDRGQIAVGYMQFRDIDLGLQKPIYRVAGGRYDLPLLNSLTVTWTHNGAALGVITPSSGTVPGTNTVIVGNSRGLLGQVEKLLPTYWTYSQSTFVANAIPLPTSLTQALYGMPYHAGTSLDVFRLAESQYAICGTVQRKDPEIGALEHGRESAFVWESGQSGSPPADVLPPIFANYSMVDSTATGVSADASGNLFVVGSTGGFGFVGQTVEEGDYFPFPGGTTSGFVHSYSIPAHPYRSEGSTYRRATVWVPRSDNIGGPFSKYEPLDLRALLIHQGDFSARDYFFEVATGISDLYSEPGKFRVSGNCYQRMDAADYVAYPFSDKVMRGFTAEIDASAKSKWQIRFQVDRTQSDGEVNDPGSRHYFDGVVAKFYALDNDNDPMNDELVATYNVGIEPAAIENALLDPMTEYGGEQIGYLTLTDSGPISRTGEYRICVEVRDSHVFEEEAFGQFTRYGRFEGQQATYDMAYDRVVEWESLYGDIDLDNEVGPGDFGILSAAFGSVPGDQNWSLPADLDGDGEVGPGDFTILSVNTGSAGTWVGP